MTNISNANKSTIISFVTLILIIVSSQTLVGKNYYFSTSSGDDARTSTQAQSSTTPWKTINKLNSFFSSLAAGDSILFRRGDTFYGSIIVSKSGISSLPIVVSAYGTGNTPVISGFSTLTSWTNVGGGIYSKVISSESAPTMVLVNGIHYAMGRYPNTGWLYFETHSGTTSITDNQLPTTPNWTGAEAVIKKNNWTVDRNPITKHSAQTLTITNTGALTDTWGYYIQNSLSTLDQFGEWYYNPATSTFYMYFGTVDPATKTIQVSTNDNVISFSSGYNYININNLSFIGGNKLGISIKSSNYINVKNCNIDYSGNVGIYIYYSNSCTVENTTVNHSNDRGIYSGSTSNNTIIRNCIIKNTELIFGHGISNYMSGVGIFAFQGDNILLENNAIDSSSYCAIKMGGNNQIVRNNLLNHFGLTKTDGGGIYYGSESLYSNMIIDGNIIMNGTGGVDGKPLGSLIGGARGIYIDQNSTLPITISNNSVANCMAHGIFIHSSNHISIIGNTVYNCNYAIGFQETDDFSTLINNLKVANNIFVAKETTKLTVLGRLKAGSTYKGLGVFDNNVYARPISEPATIKAFVTLWDGTAFNLSSWKTISGQDANSRTSPISITNTSDLRFEYNETNTNKVVALSVPYIDVFGTVYSGSITIFPHKSVVLIKSQSNTTGTNSIPTIQNQNFSINPNSSTGATVGTVVASDPDAGQALTYSIISGNSNGAFAINSSTGIITVANSSALANVAGSIDYSLFQSTTPPSSSTNILGNGTAPYEIGMKFSSNINGYITGFLYYKGVGAKGTHIGNLWSIGGVKLASATFTGETASGWQTVTLNTPVAITANTIYIVSYFSQNGDFVFSRNYFATNIVSGPLTALASTASQSNGVFLQTTSSAFPTQSNLQTNYWADVIFSSATATSTVSASTSTSPFALVVKVQDNGIGNLSNQATITVSLNDVNNAPVINNQSFSIADNSVSGTTVGTVVASDPDAGQALTYSLISGNSNGAFAINSSTGIITVANSSALANVAGSTDYSLFQSTTPPSSSTNILGNGTAPYEIGMKFSSNINGYITGFRYYKGVGAKGTHIGNLWSIGGVKLASATFTGETASGWQTVTLNTPVAITANTIYIVSYFSQNGDFVFSRNYFATNIVSGPLTALASTASQSNGVYLQTTSSAFPTQSNLQTNYWADVIFSSVTTTPLSSSIFLSTTPPSSSTNILGNGTAPYEVGMKFSSNTNGYITGFRYYKGIGAQGTHIGNLWSIGGVKLASATFTGETASGWQTVTLNTPVAITANTIYIVSYFSQNGDFVFSRNYFATNIVSGPLTALASTASQSNGVYLQTTSSAFPTQSNLQTNYWADVIFSSTTSGSPLNTSFTLVVKVEDNGTGNLSSQAIVTINLNTVKMVNVLKIISIPPDSVSVGLPYSYEVYGSSGNENLIRYSVENLPNWLHFSDNKNGTGVFKGIPDKRDIGSYEIILNGKDNLHEVKQTFTIEVKSTISKEISQKDRGIVIYPNPVTNGILNIRFDERVQEKFELLIYEMSGKLLIKKQFEQVNSLSLDLSPFPPGVYLIKYLSPDFQFSDKFIIR